MNKQEAIIAIANGSTVRHDSFTSTEWVKLDSTGRRYEFEDGNKYPINEFWKYRDHPNFNDGWTVIKPN